MGIGTFIFLSLLIYAGTGMAQTLTRRPSVIFVLFIIFCVCVGIILVERIRGKDDKTGICIFIIGVVIYIVILMVAATFTWPLVEMLIWS